MNLITKADDERIVQILADDEVGCCAGETAMLAHSLRAVLEERDALQINLENVTRVKEVMIRGNCDLVAKISQLEGLLAMRLDLFQDINERLCAAKNARDAALVRAERAERALIDNGFKDMGGAEWKPPVNKYAVLYREALAAKVEAERRPCRMREALKEYVDVCGSVHEKDCPKDDTCGCKWKYVNDMVNAALTSSSPCAHAKETARMKLLCDHLDHENAAYERLHHHAVEERDRLRSLADDVPGLTAAILSVSFDREGESWADTVARRVREYLKEGK